MPTMSLDFAWLGQGLALDLVNTYVPAQDVDLLDRWPDLISWRIDVSEAARVRQLATTVVTALAQGEPLGRELRALVNDMSLADPDRVTLTEHGGVAASSGLGGAVARDLMAVISERSAVARCGAPGCGMAFIRSRASQHWCTNSCGNRARVARHAARQHAGREGATSVDSVASSQAPRPAMLPVDGR